MIFRQNYFQTKLPGARNPSIDWSNKLQFGMTQHGRPHRSGESQMRHASHVARPNNEIISRTDTSKDGCSANLRLATGQFTFRAGEPKKFPGVLHVLGMALGAGCGRHFADAAPLSQAIPPSLGPCAMEKAHPSCNRR
jgi:hypothetical protein